jgi:hypothetical protein
MPEADWKSPERPIPRRYTTLPYASRISEPSVYNAINASPKPARWRFNGSVAKRLLANRRTIKQHMALFV